MRTIFRSMMGQMALLTVLVLALGVYYLAFRPINTLRATERVGPMELTISAVSGAINGFTFAEREAPGTGTPIESSAVIRAVRAANPEFRYYVIVNGREYGDVNSVTHFERLGLGRLDRIRRDVSYPELCVQFSRDLNEDNGRGYLNYNGCGSGSYTEFSGIRLPVITRGESLFAVYRKMIWAYGGGFIVSSLLLLVLCIAVILVNLIMIRRTARLAREIDPERMNRALPETGLPNEVVPLVQAVNQLIARSDAEQRRRRLFLSAAAHEMKTPLTILRTRLEELDEGWVKDKLVLDVRKLTNLVTQLLKLMGISERPRATTTFDLVQAVSAAVQAKEMAAGDGAIRLRFGTTQTTRMIEGDQALVEGAIGNLLENAISFSPPGGEVEVSIDANGTVKVRDHGPGIGGRSGASLFEPFVSFPPNRQGHGLGLAIVKAIVEVHGGNASAENAPGDGALFEVSFERPGPSD